jgi:hypothetical protein
MSDLVSLRLALKASISHLELVMDSLDHAYPIVIDMGELLQKCRHELRQLEYPAGV